jgi:hypothetical protein
MTARAYRHHGGRLAGKADDRHVVERGHDLAVDHRIHREPGLHGELVLIDGRQRVGQVGHVDLREEAKLAEVHAEDGRILPVGKPHRPQHRAISAEADHQVRAAAQLSRGNGFRGAVEPLDLGVDA